VQGSKGRLVGLGISALVLIVSGCDNPPPRQEKKLALPKGESTLDDLIKKSQAKSAPPSVPAHFDVSPARLDFPAVPVGEAVSRRVQLNNSGELPGTILQLHVAGQSSAFHIGGSCEGGLDIQGKHNCVVEVTFRPVRDGATDGELVINHSAVGGSLFVPLAGHAGATQIIPVAPAEPAMATSNAQASLFFARSRQDGGLTVETDMAGQIKRRVADQDYAEAGLPGIVSTFPVDRTRVITADRYIPAVLENTINSQLPGRAIAVVERHVYGSDGRSILIPAGSRAIGRYGSMAKLGEARLAISWSRIIRPDGVSINIDTQAADIMGQTGLPGDLDSRFFEKYGSSLLTSVIAAAGDWALNGSSTTVTGALGGATQVQSGRARAANRLGNDLDQLGQRMVLENVNIQPVLTVPQGTRLNIVPTEDIWLRDPDRLQAVTSAKGTGIKGASPNLDLLTQLIPGIVEMIAENPTMQRIAPQTAQQILQASLLQQLRNGNIATSGAGNAAAPSGNGGVSNSAANPTTGASSSSTVTGQRP
jgi:hypothetical protein